MFTPMSITSLDQGGDLAHWHVRRLYGEKVDPDIDRSERHAEIAVAEAADPMTTRAQLGARLAILIWCDRKIVRLPHGKGHEISAA